MLERSKMLCADLILMCVATFLALGLRDNFYVSSSGLSKFLPYATVTLAVAAPVLVFSGLDRAIWRYSTVTVYWRIVVVVAAIILISTIVGFTVNRLEGVARSLPIIQGLLMCSAMVGFRVSARAYHRLRRSRKPGAVIQSSAPGSMVVIGVNAISDLFLRAVGEVSTERVHVAGVVSTNDRHLGRQVAGYPVLGSAVDIEAIIDELVVHGVHVVRVVVTEPIERLSDATREAVSRLENNIDIAVDFLVNRLLTPSGGEAFGAATTRVITNDTRALRYSALPVAHQGYRATKRAVDIVLSICLIALLSPVLLVVTALVALDVGLPILFWQQRPGRMGKTFRLYKFRTMGAKRDRHGRIRSEEERTSRVGWWLRRLRLDEFPQLFNILVGDMSFVGPRPLLPVDQPSGSVARLLVRPGLTGWAQITGGRTVSPQDKAALDEWYLTRASLLLDFTILVRTVPFVLRGERLERPAM